MKKFILIPVIALMSTLPVQAVDTSDLQEAVEASNLPAVKKYIRRLAGPLQPKEKSALIQVAEDILEERESKISLSENSKELAKAVTGSALALVAAYAAKKFGTGSVRVVGQRAERMLLDEPDQDTYRTVFSWFPLLSFSALSMSGMYLAAQGFLCTSAKKSVDTARKVLAEVMKAPVIGGEKDQVAAVAAQEVVEKA